MKGIEIKAHSELVALNALLPAHTYGAITPHDTNALPGGIARGFWVGTAGDVTVRDLDGNTVLLGSVQEGIIHWFMCDRIHNTGTAAGDIVAVY